jgi:hypothetical protein
MFAFRWVTKPASLRGGSDVVMMLRSPVLNTESQGASEQCVATQYSNLASNTYNLQGNITLRCVQYTGRGKVHPITGHESPEGEKRYSSTLPSTSALDGVGGQRNAPVALPPGKTRYPLYRRLGGSQSRSGQVRKISPSTGFDHRTLQPVASRYTD